MKYWWAYDYIRLPFALGRPFSSDWWDIARAVRVLHALPPVTITFFGGREAYEEGKYTHWARELAQACVANRMAIITGGGPGIMAAANMSAQAEALQRGYTGLWSLGVRVEGVDDDFIPTGIQSITLPHFFMRKWCMIYYAQGFVVFPGGIGTLDELFEILNLMKTGKMPTAPVVLMGTNYWRSLLAWYEHAIEYELIQVQYKDMLHVTDDLQQAISILCATCRVHPSQD